MKEDVEFSIIIPCFNVENYIEKSINSILSQSYKNFEIIAIDDGSTDTTGKLLDEKFSNYQNVKIIHKENGGLSNARNIGIEKSNGEYLIFLDSDDYWNNSNALQIIHNYIDKYNNDIVVIGFTKFFEDTNKMIEKKKINYTSQNIEYLIQTNYFKACAWDKIVKKSLITNNDIYFPSNLFSEDIIWCAKLLQYTKKIGCIEKNFYVYRQRGNSISKNIKEKNIKDIIFMLKEAMEYNDNLINAYLSYEYIVALGLISSYKVKKYISINTQNELFNLKKLLNYSISKKTIIVRWLSKLLGIKVTSIILGFFIDLKDTKEK